MSQQVTIQGSTWGDVFVSNGCIGCAYDMGNSVVIEFFTLATNGDLIRARNSQPFNFDERLLFVRAAENRFGSIAVGGQGQSSGKFKYSGLLGVPDIETYGTHVCDIVAKDDGQFSWAVQIAPEGYLQDSNEQKLLPHEIWGSSQGIIQILNGQPIWSDLARASQPQMLYPYAEWDTYVGEGATDPAHIQAIEAGVLKNIYNGIAERPRSAYNPAINVYAVASRSGAGVSFNFFRKPLTDITIIIPPEPEPEPEPEPPPIDPEEPMPPLLITFPELRNMEMRLEDTYKNHGGHPPMTYTIHVNPEGFVWREHYWIRREQGMNHEQAIRSIESDIDIIEGRPDRWASNGSPPPVGSLYSLSGLVNLVDDKYFGDNNGIISPIGSGLLYGLSDGIDPRSLLDFYAGRIHFVRVFGGRLTPSDSRYGQDPQAALDRLPQLLQWGAERNIRFEITCLTDTGVSYDERRQCEEIAKTARNYRETVLGIEVVNEWGHPSQRDISYDELIEYKDIIRQYYDGPIALGADLEHDEIDPESGVYPTAFTGPNAYSTVHLNRDKKPSYREANRIKELYDIRNLHSCGGCNNEPGRFDDPSLDEPDGLGHHRFAYLLGALPAAWGFASIAHSSFARDIYVPSGSELEYFEAYLRGANAIPRGKYQWQNANNTGNWPDSPVKSGAFAEGPANSDSKALWRAYSYLGPRNLVIASGEDPSQFNIEYQNGWHALGMIDEQYKVQIIEIGQ